jgi:hypothetical protein
MNCVFEKYIVELILFAGCVLAHPLARLIVSYGTYVDDNKRRNDIQTVQLVFVIMFGSLIAFSLLIS